MNHFEQFNEIISNFNKEKITYMIIRGFMLLPITPDSDLDIVIKTEDFDKAVKILCEFCDERKEVSKNINLNDSNFLIYKSYRTRGKHDSKIKNGCFQLDIYNHAFNFEGKTFNYHREYLENYFFKKRIQRENYYIPSGGSEIILLLFRGLFDHNGNMQRKHLNRINNLFIKKEIKDEVNNILTIIKKEEPEYFKKIEYFFKKNII